MLGDMHFIASADRPAATRLAADRAKPCARSPDLCAAFSAAFPEPRTFQLTRSEKLPGFDGYDGPAQPVNLERRPHRLVRLHANRYAVVALEKDTNPSHASPGAVSIAYVRKQNARWIVDRRWLELIWPGADGRPADDTRLVKFGRSPLLLVDQNDGRQGDFRTDTWVIRLGGGGPEYNGVFTSSGSAERIDRPGYLFRYSSKITRPRRPGFILSLHYGGTRTDPRRPLGPAHRFTAWTDLKVVHHRIILSPPVRLPN